MSGQVVKNRQKDSGPDVQDPLQTYRDKRSADSTNEPFGAPRWRDKHSESVGRGVFVTHKHAARRLHWDLRIEFDGVLRSWAIPQGPSLDPSVKRLAVLTEDHPLEYIDFEGVIPKGNYGAGAMIVWDRGSFDALEDMDSGFSDGKLLFELHGRKLRGVWTLVRTQGGEGNQWLLIKKPDGGASTLGAAEPDQASVLSGLTIEELRDGSARIDALRQKLEALGAPKKKVRIDGQKPMLAELREKPFSRPGWLFELKYDGFRMLAEKRQDKVELRYRSGTDASRRFPELTSTLKAQPFGSFLIDAEVVVLDDDGRPNFQRMQRRAQLTRERDVRRAVIEHPTTLYVFDLLAFEGYDLRRLPLSTRKELLQQMLPGSGPIRFADHIETEGRALFDQVQKIGVEGIVAKKADSMYVARRHPSWLKVRVQKTDDFIVVGFTEPEGSRVGFGGLHLATYIDGDLHCIGRVGSGFREKELIAMRKTLDEIVRATPPCKGELSHRATSTWVEPRIVLEIRYTLITDDMRLRNPVFLRLRTDKKPEECILQDTHVGEERDEPPSPKELEEIETEAKEVVISNRDKVFWPEEGYTKGDLIDFYETVSDWILPYLRDRPLVLTRYPDGIEGKNFFQKNAPPYVPGWVRLEKQWSEHAEREIDYFVVNDVESLAYVANMASIPLHVWASRTSDLPHPDWCVLDLDPKDAPFTDVVRIANKIHEICEAIELPNFVKTSGSSGLHVVIPLGGQMTYEQSRNLAQLIGSIVVDELGDIATVNRSKKAREGRVYIDYVQNGHGRLIVAPLSVRPLRGAPVATPLHWDEVDEKLDAKRFTIRTVPKRLRDEGEDPLRPVLYLRPDLPKVLEKLSSLLEE